MKRDNSNVVAYPSKYLLFRCVVYLQSKNDDCAFCVFY